MFPYKEWIIQFSLGIFKVKLEYAVKYTAYI